MAPLGTLWTVDAQWTGKIIRAVASFTGAEISLPDRYEHFVDNKKADFLAKFPLGKIPAFEGPDGFKLTEGIPIARFVAARSPESGLLGLTGEEAGLIDQWIHLVETEVDVNVEYASYIARGFIPFNQDYLNAFVDRAFRGLDVLEGHLAKHKYFVGDRITLADIVIAVLAIKANTWVTNASLRKKRFPNLVRHFESVANEPQFKDILTPFAYGDKPIQSVPADKEEEVDAAGACPVDALLSGKDD